MPTKSDQKKSAEGVKAQKQKKTASAPKKTKSSPKRKTNLRKFYAEMNKLVIDAVDKEIVRRFKIIIDTGDDDISKSSLAVILNEPENTPIYDYDERLQPYIRHYLFMLKRKGTIEKKKT